MADMNKTSAEQLMAKLAELQAENEKLKQAQAARETIRFKVSEKGAVSCYGINSRFPVTLYAGQWERIIKHIPELQKFLVDNASKLATKQPKE